MRISKYESQRNWHSLSSSSSKLEREGDGGEELWLEKIDFKRGERATNGLEEEEGTTNAPEEEEERGDRRKGNLDGGEEEEEEGES